MARMGASAGLACALALLAAGCAQKQPEPTAGGPVAGWPRWGGDDAGTHFSADEQITPAEREAAQSRVDLPHRRPGGPGSEARHGGGGDAHPRQPDALSVLAAFADHRARSGDRPAEVDVRRQARHPRGDGDHLPRGGLLARRQRRLVRRALRPAHPRRHDRRADAGARRRDRAQVRGFRRPRRGRPAQGPRPHRKAGPVRHLVRAHHRGRHGDHRLQDHRLPQHRHARRRGARAQRAHRRRGLGLHRGAARRARRRSTASRAAPPTSGRRCRWICSAS